MGNGPEELGSIYGVSRDEEDWIRPEEGVRRLDALTQHIQDMQHRLRHGKVAEGQQIRKPPLLRGIVKFSGIIEEPRDKGL